MAIGIKTADKNLENYGTLFRRCERSAVTDKWCSWISDCPQLETPQKRSLFSTVFLEGRFDHQSLLRL